MKKVLPIVNGFAFISMIVMNYLSNTGVFNGNTMKTVSDRYFNFFTPAGYAFSIWGIIYLGLFGFVFYSGRQLFNPKNEEPMLFKIGWWFTFTCVLNSFWVVAWLYEFTAVSVLLMIFMLLSLIKIMQIILLNLDYHSFKNRLFILFPFALYLGWISVALIANVAGFLTKMNWNGFGISDEYWTIALIVIAGIVNVLVLWKWNLRTFVAVGIWALLAIAVSNISNQGPESIVYSCYGVAIVLVVLTFASFLRKQTTSF
ncbi:MAG: tryptophan-rich sensory protein [Crocinitomicaceae bacterium]|nr:tryptophan-rich sensory protein [Crocinitomicaceae bacterium]